MGRADGPGKAQPTIVVPLDGSLPAERALPYAAWLARRIGARLLLLRAIMATAPASEAAARLAALARAWRAAGIAVETRCATMRADGDDLIAEAILAVANTQDAELIAMSTQGRNGLGRLRYGSVTEHVLRYAEMPVLFVPPTVDRRWPEDRPLRLLLPLDGSRDAGRVLGSVTEVLAGVPVEAVVAQVLEPAASDDVLPYPAPEAPERASPSAARSYVDAAVGSLPTLASSVEIVAAVGDPAAAFLRLAHDREADLIAMATHGPGGRGPDALGPMAQRLLHRTEVPLLLIPVPGMPTIAGNR